MIKSPYEVPFHRTLFSVHIPNGLLTRDPCFYIQLKTMTNRGSWMECRWEGRVTQRDVGGTEVCGKWVSKETVQSPCLDGGWPCWLTNTVSCFETGRGCFHHFQAWSLGSIPTRATLWKRSCPRRVHTSDLSLYMFSFALPCLPFSICIPLFSAWGK